MAQANPYIAARNHSNDRYTNLASARRNWQLVAFFLFVLLGVSEGRNFWILSQQQVQVVFALVDEGRVIRTYRIGEQERPVDEAELLRSELAEWVIQARRLSTDWTLQSETFAELYQKTSGPALGTLNSYYRKHEPRKMAEQVTIAVEITSLVPKGEKTWVARWRETKQDKETGKIVEAKKWEAWLTVERHPVTTLKMALTNPLGLDVKTLSWSEDVNQ